MTKCGLKAMIKTVEDLKRYWSLVANTPSNIELSILLHGKTREEYLCLANYFEGKYDAYCDLLNSDLFEGED